MRNTRSYLKLGAIAGALFGALFAFGVIALADCAGAACLRERIIGVAGHALAGAVLGGVLGGAADLITRRSARRSERGTSTS